VKGIDTRLRKNSFLLPPPERRNEFPDVKGIDTVNVSGSIVRNSPCRNEFPDVKGIDTPSWLWLPRRIPE